MISKVNILIVDDVPANLLAMEAILTPLGENIIKAQSGEEALRLLAQDEYAVIVLDVQMAGMDGVETAHLIKEHEETHDTPIVFLTAFDDTQLAALRGYALGAVDYLIKPIVPEILLAKVRTFVDLRKKTQRMKDQLDVIKQLKHETHEQQRVNEERQELLTREQAAREQAELAEGRLAFLAAAGSLLSASLDYETTLYGLAQLCVPFLADWSSVQVLEGEGQLRSVDLVVQRPEIRDVILEIRERYPFRQEDTFGIAQVLRSGEAIFNPTISIPVVAPYTRDARHLELIQKLGVVSAIVVPMRARGRTLGIISLNMAESNRHYTLDDLALAKELASRAALALDNARLYREAQDAVQIRDEFLSIAAHELKTPITSLRGFSQALLRQLDKGASVEPVRLQHVLQAIEQQSNKLTSLVTRLLDVSTLESGQLGLRVEQIDVGRLVEDVVGTMRLQTANHTFIVSVRDRVLASVDPLRLEQVLINLLDNAIKYSPHGSVIDVQVVQENAELCIAVTDQGIGIPPETQAHLFTRFFRAHGTQHISGIGLGLFIANEIVRLHGGLLNVESLLEGGTRFIVRLPITRE